MYLTRCSACDARVEVQDENAISVRCSSCGQTITLRESSAEKDYRDKSEARRERSEKVPINYFVEWLPILISVPLALLFLLLTCILPKFFPAALGAGFVIAASGFGKSCTLAGKEGNYVGPDYLDVLGGIRWVIIIVLFPLYVFGYCMLWQIAVVGCAIQKPRMFVPWIAMQAFGWIVFFLGIVCALVGNAIWAHLGD